METKQSVYLLWYTPTTIYGCDPVLHGVYSSFESAKKATNISDSRKWFGDGVYELWIYTDPLYMPSNTKSSLKNAKFRIEQPDVDPDRKW